MKTGFKSSFAKDLKAIKNKTVLEAVAKLIDVVEAAQNLRAVPDVKKLKTKGDYYRIKLGDYRVGITLDKDEITFVRCLDRKRDLQVFSVTAAAELYSVSQTQNRWRPEERKVLNGTS